MEDKINRFPCFLRAENGSSDARGSIAKRELRTLS